MENIMFYFYTILVNASIRSSLRKSKSKEAIKLIIINILLGIGK